MAVGLRVSSRWVTVGQSDLYHYISMASSKSICFVGTKIPSDSSPELNKADTKYQELMKLERLVH